MLIIILLENNQVDFVKISSWILFFWRLKVCSVCVKCGLNRLITMFASSLMKPRYFFIIDLHRLK